MSPSATSSRPGPAAWLVLFLALLVPAGSAGGGAPAGKVYLTVDEALALAFPGCEVERTTAYLSEEQVERATKLAGDEVERRLAYPYVARKDGQVVGRAYFDTHDVRTLRETLMVVVDPRDRVARLEVLAFAEPEEYLPRAKWYGQFLGRALDDELNLGRGIRGVSGATLTARATTRAVRRVLAVHTVLKEPEAR